jgi:hypothetical protein
MLLRSRFKGKVKIQDRKTQDLRQESGFARMTHNGGMNRNA